MRDLGRSDLPILAARTRLAGELIADLGDTTWRRATEWTPGPAAAHYDPDGTGGWRYAPCGDPTCTDCPHPIPADPTGETITRPAPTFTLDHLTDALAALDQAVATVTDMIGTANPQRHVRRRPTTPDDAPDGWCKSCFTADGGHVPVADRYAGLALCRWCGDWRANHDGNLPPPALTRLHRAGERITPEREAKILAAHRAQKKRKKQRR